MTPRHHFAAALCILTIVLPTAANSQAHAHPDASADSAAPPAHAAAATTPATATAPAPAAATAMLQRDLAVDDRFESLLDTGCTYEVTIRGTVRPVRENAGADAATQRLRPDLRVAATVRCPQSTESHIQERRVYSTGVTREELERLVELNASVDRMQNSGRCLYVPGVAFSTNGFATTELGYLCPRTTSTIHGGAAHAPGAAHPAPAAHPAAAAHPAHPAH